MEINNKYGGENYSIRDDMSIASFHCSKFARRHDFSAFNMSNYQSCENCRNYTEDNLCISKVKDGIITTMT